MMNNCIMRKMYAQKSSAKTSFLLEKNEIFVCKSWQLLRFSYAFVCFCVRLCVCMCMYVFMYVCMYVWCVYVCVVQSFLIPVFEQMCDYNQCCDTSPLNLCVFLTGTFINRKTERLADSMDQQQTQRWRLIAKCSLSNDVSAWMKVPTWTVKRHRLVNNLPFWLAQLM